MKGHWNCASENERAELNDLWVRCVTRMQVKVEKDVEYMRELETAADTVLPMTNRNAVSNSEFFNYLLCRNDHLPA